jgi:hypothetical protein
MDKVWVALNIPVTIVVGTWVKNPVNIKVISIVGLNPVVISSRVHPRSRMSHVI